jgi:hypothetical protein
MSLQLWSTGHVPRPSFKILSPQGSEVPGEGAWESGRYQSESKGSPRGLCPWAQELVKKPSLDKSEMTENLLRIMIKLITHHININPHLHCDAKSRGRQGGMPTSKCDRCDRIDSSTSENPQKTHKG